MHDLVQQMGTQIVRQESSHNPGERSRLWCHKDVLKVLTKNKVYISCFDSLSLFFFTW